MSNRGSVNRGAGERLRVAVVNDHELVRAGVRALLQPHAERIEVETYADGLPAAGSADVVLFDPFGSPARLGRLVELLRRGAPVIVHGRADDPRQAEVALRLGATDFLPLTMDGTSILAAVEAAHAGARVYDVAIGAETDRKSWPGQGAGLTAREADVVSLIMLGLSNAELAAVTYLSVNSVKTYIRTAYRKMQVTSRSQAILWGFEHGFVG